MGNTTTLENKSKFRELLDSFGLPRLIIACFLLLLLIAAPIVGLDFPTQITNIITRFSWNAVMVLAMVPMVHSGCGLNFGLPLGIVSDCWAPRCPLSWATPALPASLWPSSSPRPLLCCSAAATAGC